MFCTGTVGYSRFGFCVDFVLDHETEYDTDGHVKVEHDPHDPGGTTKFGIDQRSHPNVNVAALTEDEAKDIYFKGEWTFCRCGELKPPFDLAVFDTAVNVGNARAAKWLQKAVGAKVDGFIGPKTIEAVNAATPQQFYEFIELRRKYYTEEVRAVLRSRYLNGWLARVDDLRDASKFSLSEMQIA